MKLRIRRRTDAGSGADVENATHLVRVDRREEQLLADALGHEDVRQVESVQLRLIVRQAVRCKRSKSASSSI